MPEASDPTCSVVIPTRDRAGRLAVTLAGALAQRDVSVEVVVVDSSTRADQRAAVDRLAADPRVRVHRPAAPLLPAAARNAGAELARGTWVAFLDDDDLWAPHKLATQLAEADRAGARWAWCGAWYVGADGRPSWMAEGPPAGVVAATLPGGNVVPAGSSAVVVHRELLDAVGGFDEAIVHMPDWDLWLRLAAADAGAGCREALVAYIQHEGMLSRRDTMAFEADLARIEDKLRARGENGRRDAVARRGLLDWMAGGHLAAGHRTRASRAWLRSGIVTRHPGDLARAAAALGGRRAVGLTERALARAGGHRRAEADPALPPTPAWLRDYPGFPVDEG